MFRNKSVVHAFDTELGHYEVVDMTYEGRPARVLFSGHQRAAQSGIATDGKSDLLFDYLQRLYELVDGFRPKRILMIGGGMFTLPTAILNTLSDGSIDVIELDEGLEVVAKNYFGLVHDERLRIINGDGLRYLEQCDETYDMIIVDAYAHDVAEASLASEAAVIAMRRRLNPSGLVAANIISAYFGRRAAALQRLMADYDGSFADVSVYPASQSLSLWLPQNLVMIAQTTTDQALDGWLRYRRLEPAEVHPFDIGRDLRL